MVVPTFPRSEVVVFTCFAWLFHLIQPCKILMYFSIVAEGHNASAPTCAEVVHCEMRRVECIVHANIPNEQLDQKQM